MEGCTALDERDDMRQPAKDCLPGLLADSLRLVSLIASANPFLALSSHLVVSAHVRIGLIKLHSGISFRCASVQSTYLKEGFHERHFLIHLANSIRVCAFRKRRR
jgi:hypothetical protein